MVAADADFACCSRRSTCVEGIPLSERHRTGPSACPPPWIRRTGLIRAEEHAQNQRTHVRALAFTHPHRYRDEDLSARGL
jgi:hypothetical protein